MLKKHGLIEASKRKRNASKGGGGAAESGAARAGRQAQDAPAGVGGEVPEPDPPGVLSNLRAIQNAFGGWSGREEQPLTRGESGEEQPLTRGESGEEQPLTRGESVCLLQLQVRLTVSRLLYPISSSPLSPPRP